MKSPLASLLELTYMSYRQFAATCVCMRHHRHDLRTKPELLRNVQSCTVSGTPYLATNRPCTLVAPGSGKAACFCLHFRVAAEPACQSSYVHLRGCRTLSATFPKLFRRLHRAVSGIA